ncbi:MAG: tetratricopeptide repeat protein [Gammaproteobacteria bacterium]|nr:tetratricopeptide repeat protein [Gammaproteobacteria bacterium]
MNKISFLTLVTLSSLLMVSCSHTPKQPTAEKLKQVRPENAQITSPEKTTVAALKTLADKADYLARSGSLEAAASTLERALRIDSRSPGLWTRLANVRLEQGRYAQAEQLAKRSNSLAKNDGFIQSVNWNLIAISRINRGDIEGEERALKESERVKSLHN